MRTSPGICVAAAATHIPGSGGSPSARLIDPRQTLVAVLNHVRRRFARLKLGAYLLKVRSESFELIPLLAGNFLKVLLLVSRTGRAVQFSGWAILDRVHLLRGLMGHVIVVEPLSAKALSDRTHRLQIAQPQRGRLMDDSD